MEASLVGLRDGVSAATVRAVGTWWLVVPLGLMGYRLARGVGSWYPGEQITSDSALFLYSGRAWVLAGRVPYKETWDIKGPLTHETTAAIALVTGGDPVLMNILGVVLNLGCVLGTVAATATAVYRLTASKWGGGLAGACFMAYPTIASLAYTGFRPKYPVMFAVSLVVLAGVEREWGVAAGSAAVAAAYWQFSAVVLVLVLAAVAWYGRTGSLDRSAEYRVVGAVGAVALVALGPFVLSGAGPQLVVQTVLAPFGTHSSSLGSLLSTVNQLNPILLTVGFLGTLAVGRTVDHPIRWWPFVALVATGSVALVTGQVGDPDLLMLKGITALAVGLGVASVVRVDSETVLSHPAVWVVPIVVVTILMVESPEFGRLFPSYMTEMFFEGEIVARCHVRLSGPEKEMIELVGGYIGDKTCWSPF